MHLLWKCGKKMRRTAVKCQHKPGQKRLSETEPLYSYFFFCHLWLKCSVKLSTLQLFLSVYSFILCYTVNLIQNRFKYIRYYMVYLYFTEITLKWRLQSTRASYFVASLCLFLNSCCSHISDGWNKSEERRKGRKELQKYNLGNEKRRIQYLRVNAAPCWTSVELHQLRTRESTPQQAN